MSIIITADSSCDLAAQAVAPIALEVFPLTIIQNGVEYKDGLEIKPEEIYARVTQGAPVPTTSAVNIADYQERFAKLSSEHEAVIHISLGAELSSCHSHARIAAEAFSNIYVVNTGNISVGQGLFVLEARRMILEGASPADIASYLTALVARVEFTFILDQVSYLHKGGRCSNIAALGANLLKLKPVIAVQSGHLRMVRKYRGAFEKILPDFFRDLLKDRRDLDIEKTMLVTTHCPPQWTRLAVDQIELHSSHRVQGLFYAGCTISSHSGPKALGVALVRKA